MNDVSHLRNYKPNTPQYHLYKEMHTKQTLTYVNSKQNQYSQLNNCKMNIKDALNMMDEFIDPSDPDLDLPNLVHAYQTAERIKKKYPNNYEFQICGLIHDIGKVLYKFGEPSWAIVGDTFVVGCQYPKSIVYYDTLKNNPDFTNPFSNSKYGIYKEKCGIENLKISFGHDEYLYLVLKHNNHHLSDRYLNMIRFHSFYPWHTSNEYKYFMKDGDEKILEDVLLLNHFDLYSKEDVDFVLTDEIKEYYSKLLDHYFPNELQW